MHDLRVVQLGPNSADVTDWVAYNARRFPGRIAIEDLESGRSLTWRALDHRVGRLASALLDRLGVRAGDRVGVLAEDHSNVLEVQFACVRVGAVFTPFNWRLAPAELEVLVKDADVAVLFTDALWRDAAETLSRSVGGVPVATWGCTDSAFDLETEIERAAPLRAPSGHSAAQVTQILYTSGTTGLPKGALIDAGAMAWNAVNAAQPLRLAVDGARYLSGLPLFHAAGLNAVTNPVLMFGGTVSVLRRFDPDRVAALLGSPEHGFTHFCGAPVMFRLTAEASSASAGFGHIAGALVGGGPIETDVARFFRERGLTLQGGWGATEMGPNTTVMPREHATAKTGTVGFPVQHVELRVVDPGSGSDVELGGEGEAWVRGPSITTGYWRRERDPGVITEDGWFRSGDAVSLDEDGFVLLRGRFKDMYKSGGENVFAAEVERVLAEHPAVQDVAVIGVPDSRWGEVGRAVVVTRPGQTIDLASIVAHCAGRLARYKIPAGLSVVEDLPRNVTGKVQKGELRSRFG